VGDHRFRTAIGAWTASVGVAIGLAGCASGQGSFVGGSAGDQAAASREEELLGFEDAAPNLLAASGTALLPGGRNAAVSNLLGQSPLGSVAGGLAPSLVSGVASGPAVSITAAGVNANAALGGQGSPLVGLNGRSVLGGSPVGGRLGVAPGGGVSAGLGANPQGVAPTLISGLGAATPAPVAPVSRVPGAQPLQTLVSGLRPPGS
jgi:hypothetical protein